MLAHGNIPGFFQTGLIDTDYFCFQFYVCIHDMSNYISPAYITCKDSCQSELMIKRSVDAAVILHSRMAN